MLASLVAFSCSGKRGTAQGYNVLLITIDTLRADHLGAYGDATAQTPALDSIASAGLRFEHAIAPAPLTLPSHATILSGLYPQRHGLRNNGAGAFPDRLPTLATLFAARGYRTGAFVGAFVLDHRFGLNRGFETYDDEIPRDPNAPAGIEAERPAKTVVDRAVEWISRSDARPFFAWVHVYDAHAPYAPPEPFRSAFAARPYDGEIAYVDSQIARLLAELRRSGADRKTVIIVAGDHGEALGEHGELTHGLLLYEATLRVPLFVSAPGVLRPGRVATPVSLADLTPTIASLTGIPFEGKADGADLAAKLARNEELPVRDLYSETEYPTLFGWSSLQALRRGPLKLIQSPAPELYDLARDPAETRNLYAENRRAMSSLRASLQAMARDAAAPRTAPMDAETARKLASLGYVGGAPAPRSDARPPREMAGLFRRFEEATWALNGDAVAQAIHSFTALVREDPGNPVFRGSLAKALRRAGRMDEAIDLARESVALQPDDPEAWYNLAAAFQERGDHRRAVDAVREALRRDPRRPEAHNILGIAYSAEGKLEAALEEFDRCLALDPRNARALNNRGNTLRAMQRFDDAGAAYRRAIEIAPDYPDPWNGLGTLSVERDRPREALPYFDRALHLAPGNHETRLNRAVAHQLAGDITAAIRDYEAFITESKNAPEFEPQRRAALTMVRRLSGALP